MLLILGGRLLRTMQCSDQIHTSLIEMCVVLCIVKLQAKLERPSGVQAEAVSLRHIALIEICVIRSLLQVPD